MERIDLGRTGLRVSRLGFGCSQIASLSSRHTPAEVRATLEEAVAQGINFFDTADVYGQGDSERLLGELGRGRREHMIICTKAGLHLGAKQKLVRWVKPFLQPVLRHFSSARGSVTARRMQAQRQCFDVVWLERHLHGSLRRLRSDYVDIFLLHGPSPAEVEREKLLPFLSKVLRSGMARQVGISCAEHAHLPEWIGVEPLSVFQVPASFWQPEAFRETLPQAHAAGAGVVLREVLQGGRANPELALRFLADRAQAEVILCGMSCREHLRANLRAFEREPLSAEERSLLQT